MSREVIGLVAATSMAISLLKCTLEVNYFHVLHPSTLV